MAKLGGGDFQSGEKDEIVDEPVGTEEEDYNRVFEVDPETLSIALSETNATLYYVIAIFTGMEKMKLYLEDKKASMTVRDINEVSNSMAQHSFLSVRNGGVLGVLDKERAETLHARFGGYSAFDAIFHQTQANYLVIADLQVRGIVARLHGAKSFKDRTVLGGVTIDFDASGRPTVNLDDIVKLLNRFTQLSFQIVKTTKEDMRLAGIVSLVSRVDIDPQTRGFKYSLSQEFVQHMEKYWNMGRFKGDLQEMAAKITKMIQANTYGAGIQKQNIYFILLTFIARLSQEVKNSLTKVAAYKRIVSVMENEFGKKLEEIRQVLRGKLSDYLRVNSAMIPNNADGIVTERRARTAFRNSTQARRALADLSIQRFFSTHLKWVRMCDAISETLAAGYELGMKDVRVHAFGVGSRHWEGALSQAFNPKNVTYYDIVRGANVHDQDITDLPDDFGKGSILLDDVQLKTAVKGMKYKDQSGKIDSIIKANYDLAVIKMHYNEYCTSKVPDYMLRLCKAYTNVRAFETHRPHSTEFFLLCSKGPKIPKEHVEEWWKGFVMAKGRRVACGDYMRHIVTFALMDGMTEFREFGVNFDALDRIPYEGTILYQTGRTAGVNVGKMEITEEFDEKNVLL